LPTRATARGRRHAFDGRQQAAWNAPNYVSASS